MIDTFMESFLVLSKQQCINRRQKELYNLFTNLTKIMQEINLKDKRDINITYNLNDLIMKKSTIFFVLLNDSNIKLEFEFETQGNMLLDSLTSIEVITFLITL